MDMDGFRIVYEVTGQALHVLPGLCRLCRLQTLQDAQNQPSCGTSNYMGAYLFAIVPTKRGLIGCC
jgi:hypothetical protein